VEKRQRSEDIGQGRVDNERSSTQSRASRPRPFHQWSRSSELAVMAQGTDRLSGLDPRSVGPLLILSRSSSSRRLLSWPPSAASTLLPLTPHMTYWLWTSASARSRPLIRRKAHNSRNTRHIR
jgi:hypothetical protein